MRDELLVRQAGGRSRCPPISAVILVVVGTAAVCLAGCGAEPTSSRTSPTTRSDEATVSTSDPTPSSIGTQSSTVATVAMPSSVDSIASVPAAESATPERDLATQFSTFIGGGPEDCFLDEDATLPYARLTSDESPFVGQMVQICAAGFAREPLELTLEAPDGHTYRSSIVIDEAADVDRLIPGPMNGDRIVQAITSDVADGVAMLQTETWFVDDTIPSGRYRMTVTQRTLTATQEVNVEPADAPGIRSVSQSPNGTMTFAVYGYLPGETVRVGIFAYVGEQADGALAYERTVELPPVVVDDRGFRSFPVDLHAIGLPVNPRAVPGRDLCLVSPDVELVETTLQCGMGRSRRPSSGFRGMPEPGLYP